MQPERVAPALDRLAIGAVAEHPQLPGLAARPRKRSEQRDQVLGRCQPRGAAEHEPAPGCAAVGEGRGRIHAVVDHVQLAARLDVTLVRQREVVAGDADDGVAERRDGSLGRRVDGAGRAGAARERPAVRREDRLRAETRAREPRQHAGLGRVDLHDVRVDAAHERAQLAHGRRVVEGMRVAHEVADVVEGHAERAARIGERPAGPVRRDLDRVAVAQPGHERRREGLRAARLGERHDDEQAGPHAATRSKRRLRRPGGGVSVAPASRARKSQSGSERSTMVRCSSL